jgi:phosphate starvation-inducible PhoH-like protein
MVKQQKKNTRFNKQTRRTDKAGFQQDQTKKVSIVPKHNNIEVIPRNIEQEKYLEMLNDPSKFVVVCTGRAGSGKTHLATLWAIQQYQMGKVDKIVITRPNVATDGMGIGFMPGTLIEKMWDWIGPFVDAFYQAGYSKIELEKFLEIGVIEIIPIAFIRGRSLTDCVILADECQNLTKNSMLSILTRFGKNSKLVVIGDVKQSDLGRDNKNGLGDFIERFKSRVDGGVAVTSLTQCERHPVIQEILDVYEADGVWDS